MFFNNNNDNKYCSVNDDTKSSTRRIVTSDIRENHEHFILILP